MADGATPVDVKVEKAIPHEKYNPARHTTDIALVKLVDKVTFTSVYYLLNTLFELFTNRSVNKF